jgi:hypothetical protein
MPLRGRGFKTRRKQTKTRRAKRQGEPVSFREEAVEHFSDPVSPTKKPRPPPSTDTLDFLKKLVSVTPQDLEETVGNRVPSS